MTLEPVARIENDFPTKFGLPRQSGLNGALVSTVIMEKAYAREDYLRGIREFSHLWLIWGFDEARKDKATARPPKLGGNERRGVFATRTPFRPNPLGLSVVKLEKAEITEKGACLTVSGADIKSGSLIYDIKPYIPYADSVAGAKGGFADEHASDALKVVFPEELRRLIPQDKLSALERALSLDPRPQYQQDAGREYGFYYADKDVHFTVDGDVLTVTGIAEGVKHGKEKGKEKTDQ